MRMFPIQGGPSVPWDYMAPHESMCQQNHSQSLERLAERGGLCPMEAECVVTGINPFKVRDSWEYLKQAWFRRAERVNRDWGNDKDQPLVCRIEGQQLVIRIGLDVLAFCAEHCPKLYDYDQHPNGPPYCKVVDKHELANDVIGRLEHEQEDGTTPLHILFDEAIVAAMEDGSLAFGDDDE